MEDSQVKSLIVESPCATAPTPPVRAFTTVPFVFARRQRGRAWLLSLVVHGGVLALTLWGFGREVIMPAPTVKLVFVAPPPPPPLGVPEGKGAAPVAKAPPHKVEKPPPPVRPQPKPPKRVVVPKQIVKLKELKPPPVAVEPLVTTPATTSGEEPQVGIATGSVKRVEGGVADGVKGGRVDGVKEGLVSTPLHINQVAHPPVLVSRVDPDYPEIARLREIEGRVVLEAVVDHEGRIEPEVKVLQSVAVLDNAAIAALKQWRFTSGRDENGQAVRVILEVPIRFVLE
jgi:protein TonB